MKWLGSSAASATASARSVAPRPPSAKCWQTAARAPISAAISSIARHSDGWSVGKALMATTGETPWMRMFSICLRRLAPPMWTSSGFSASSASGRALPATIRWLPEWALSARTVATTTAASGWRPELRHLMLKNRSAPMSAPKPASVTRKSPLWMPIRSARTEELPWAMLPNGPAWTRTGVCSSVWRRFGFVASRRMAAMAPLPWRSSAVTGVPSLV